jgi:NADH-quinone oxidoreductase subunit F
MDIVLHTDEPSAGERDAVDAVLGPPDSRWVGALTTSDRDRRVARGGHAARAQRHLLLPVLHAVQARAGWISPGALNYICQRLTIPPAEAYGVATFYALFSLEPQPPAVAHVCTDIACMVGGAKQLCADLEARIGPKGGHHGSNGAGPGEGPIWLESPCLGMCETAPAAMVSLAGEAPREVSVDHAEADDIAALLAGGDEPAPVVPKVPQAGDPGLRLLRRIGLVDPTSVDSYRAHGGYEALRAAFDMGEQGVLREVSDSKLLGRGGAAFPTARKWAAVAAHPTRPHYLVCNADESEPGTFKDRVLLEQDPFAVIEAMTIAGFATGCEHGYLYLRGEYPLAWERLVGAVTEARARGFLGQDIFGRGINFDIELRKGAGAYICGEETALLNSIEGYRGEPRNKPPFPVDHGLFDKPTVMNNVETLVNVPGIVLEGGEAYARVGTEDSKGTRLFCLSGRVARPGLYEVPFGVTLRAVLEMAGGVTDGRPLRTVLLGGAAGRFVTPDELDVEMSFEATRELGTSMGSGVIMVVDDTVDLPAILMRIAAFFRDESCGQCVPCRVGTVRQEEALARLTNGHPRDTQEQEYALLDEITASMRDSSICGLGQTAADAIESALRKLDVFETGGQR